jgi:hypothetical protein
MENLLKVSIFFLQESTSFISAISLFKWRSLKYGPQRRQSPNLESHIPHHEWYEPSVSLGSFLASILNNEHTPQ